MFIRRKYQLNVARVLLAIALFPVHYREARRQQFTSRASLKGGLAGGNCCFLTCIGFE
jgi:hypothetical protein